MADVSQPTKENGNRLCFSIPETARMLGISRGLAYELARSGQIPVLRLGKRLLVPKIALERLLSQPNATLNGRRDEKEKAKPL